MLSAYEQHLLTSYLVNAASSLHHRDPETSELVDWIDSKESRVATGSISRRLRKRRAEDDEDEKLTARKLRGLKETLQAELAATRRGRGDRTALRLRRLGRTMGLTRADLDILELLLRYQTQPVIESLVDEVFGLRFGRSSALSVRGLALPVLLGRSMGAIQRRLAQGAPLVRAGLMSIDRDGDLSLVNRLHRLATVPGDTGGDVHDLLLDVASPSELEWSDFDHIARDRDEVARLLGGALETGARGVNVLLYGPPGTGKTELCKALAERLGITLYSVGESDDSGGEPTRGERLQELRLAQRLLSGKRRALLLFDEMEDLLSESASDFAFFSRPISARRHQGGSKIFMHRLLERAPTPTLWTINNAPEVSPAILRRMMTVLELRAPTAAVRARVWERQLERHGIEASADEVRVLATEFEATPGVANGATAAAQLAGGDFATVRNGVRRLSRLLECDRPAQGAPARFDLALVHADTDPAALAERIAARGERRFSLCLQGPPGTGKSAYARYLAERLGLEVLQRRASDLLSMWVGGSEREIAAAFAEARDTGAFLIFDEADSLLADRRFAQRSWEVSQVNEMLTWMESHPLPFACTTNFAAHLDPATLRRFVFKVTLDYLTPVQSEAAFRGYFALTPPAELAALGALTPGDFAVVRKRAEILGCLDEPASLASMLREECAAKPDQPRPIGFRP